MSGGVVGTGLGLLIGLLQGVVVVMMMLFGLTMAVAVF